MTSFSGFLKHELLRLVPRSWGSQHFLRSLSLFASHCTRLPPEHNPGTAVTARNSCHSYTPCRAQRLQFINCCTMLTLSYRQTERVLFQSPFPRQGSQSSETAQGLLKVIAWAGVQSQASRIQIPVPPGWHCGCGCRNPGSMSPNWTHKHTHGPITPTCAPGQ